MKLFEVSSNVADDDQINKWMHVVVEYWKNNSFVNDLEPATYGLMNAFPSCVYTGRMIRGFAFDPSERITSTIQLTSKLHKFSQENDREIFGWSRHKTPPDLFQALTMFSGSNVTKNTMFYLEQHTKGLDCVKLAQLGLNVLNLPSDDWKTLKRTHPVIEAELEVLAPFTNSVHLLGIGFGKQFYDVDNLNLAFDRLSSDR